MSTLNRTVNKIKTEGFNDLSHDVSELKKDIMEEGKKLKKDGEKLARELYKEGMSELSNVEDNIKEYSEVLVKKIKTNPLASVLIAAGCGVLLSALLKK